MNNYIPEELDECGDASRLEYGEQALPVVGEVVQGAGGAARGLHVVGVAHGPDQRGHHLRRVHDGVPRRLLLGQLVDHHGGLTDHHLVLVVEEFGQFWDGTRCQVSVILTVKSNKMPE